MDLRDFDGSGFDGFFRTWLLSLDVGLVVFSGLVSFVGSGLLGFFRTWFVSLDLD